MAAAGMLAAMSRLIFDSLESVATARSMSSRSQAFGMIRSWPGDDYAARVQSATGVSGPRVTSSRVTQPVRATSSLVA